MKVIIVFSSPNHEEYTQVWKPLISKEHGYINVNDTGDKVYAFNGKKERYHSEGEWEAGILVDEIHTIIENNNSCECVVMLHDYEIPNELTERFNNVRFKVYSSGDGTFYDNYVMPFVNRCKQESFSRLWDKLQEDETVVVKLTALFSACVAYAVGGYNGEDTWKIAFGSSFNENFEDTDVCEELQAKGIEPTEKEYINIKSLFDHIRKNNSVDGKIITTATASLSDILQNNKQNHLQKR